MPLDSAPRIKTVPNLPNYRWNEAAKQYIAPNGQFVPRSEIRRGLDQFINQTSQLMDDVSARLVAGDIDLKQWETAMKTLSKQSNLSGVGMNKGGWYQMDSADFGRAGRKIRDEYGHIRNFAQQIESGEQALDGTLRRRARLYGQQGRATYYDETRLTAERDGFKQERSVLNPADHCEECVGEASRGWVKLHSLIRIGSRTCRTNCQCHMEYRKKAGGDRRIV